MLWTSCASPLYFPQAVHEPEKKSVMVEAASSSDAADAKNRECDLSAEELPKGKKNGEVGGQVYPYVMLSGHTTSAITEGSRMLNGFNGELGL